MDGNKATAIARIGEGDHVIVAATGDRVGPLWRRQSNKNANDQVRASFRNMLVNIFEGEENIPASARAVLKEHDYGQGKPLTARRISAVCNACASAPNRSGRTSRFRRMPARRSASDGFSAARASSRSSAPVAARGGSTSRVSSGTSRCLLR